MSKQKLKKISKELKKASNLHAGQAKKIDNMIKKSPTLLKKGKNLGRLNEKKTKLGRLNEKKTKLGRVSEEDRKKRYLENVKKQYGIDKTKKSTMKLKSRNVANATAKKTSPALAKLSASCKAAAKRKFKVYPSAYANMWAAKTQRQGKC